MHYDFTEIDELESYELIKNPQLLELSDGSSGFRIGICTMEGLESGYVGDEVFIVNLHLASIRGVSLNNSIIKKV